MKNISRIISCMFILSILLPLFTVNAALPSPNPETINLISSYSSGVSGFNIGQGYQRVLSNYPTLSLNVSLDAGAGNKISKIEFLKYGSPISTSIVANNIQTQNISTTFSGESKNVVSGTSGNENSTSKGYYSWYRYSSGVYWFADIPPTGQNSSNPSNCGSAISCLGDPGVYDNFNGANFWAYPNVSSNQLTMGGTKEKSYVLEDSTSITILDDYVSNDPANFSATSSLNTLTSAITGGFGELGYPDSITGSPTTTMTDKSSFTVKFSKSFTSRSSYRGDFAAAGAAWMDWFFAFKTTLHSKTFVYPDQIRVTYAPVGVATLVVTPLTKTIQVGSTTNYTATYTDTAGVSSVVTNSSAWSINNTTIATINSTGLATGANDGTVTVKAVYNGLTATAQLIVTRNALLVVTPYTDTVLVGGSTNYTATYTNTGGISSNVTNSSSWSTNNTTIATINSTGLATGKAEGSVIITAVYNGLTETAELNVISSATPTVTEAPATPTPAPPTCNTPPTVSLIAPSSVKQGEDFYVSGFGSKQANGGTNLSYQWYYWPNPSQTPVTTGPSVISPTMSITTQGSYTLILVVTDLDNPICSDQGSKNFTITAPGPAADVTVQGTLKIKRPMLFDGSSSSSPAAYPIVDGSRTLTIDYPTGVTASDCVILDPLTGTKKARIMCRKPGIYKVTYTVTNTLGLSGSSTKTFTVADDLKPVGNIQSPTVVYRDPVNSNKATIPLTLTFTSPDNDTIASTNFGAISDANNDGFFVEDINNALPVTYNLITGAATVTGTKVGHIRNILSGCETFDAGDFASYLTASDYLCAAGFMDVTVDNQAPSMSIGASKRFKADIYVNIGSVPTADQTYLLNNIQNLKANLGAQQVDANVIATQWDTNVEADFFKDSNSKLISNTWRSPIDQKYFVGYSNSLSAAGSVGTPVDPLVLKTIPAYSTPLNGTVNYAKFAPNGGRTAYISYQKPGGTSGSYTDTLFIASNGSGYDAGVMGSHTSAGTNPFNSYGGLDFDTQDRWYFTTTYETNNPGDPFRHDYSIRGAFGGTGIFKSTATNYNMYHSKPSYINNQWTVWSTAGLFYYDTWEQQETYYRTPSNGWKPATSPDYCYCGTSSPDIYTEGYQVGSNIYWFGYQGYKSGNYYNTYLALHYNGDSTPYSAYSYTIYAKQIMANGISIVVRKISDSKYYKLTFTNGTLTSEIPYTNIDPYTNGIKFNLSTNRAYYFTQAKVTVYDLATNTVILSKKPDAGIEILDMGWDTDGITPLYLFRTTLAATVYISKDGDTAAGSTDVMSNVSTADQTVSYNTNGTYSWIDQDDYYFNTYSNYDVKGRVSKIRKVDPLGNSTYKAFPGADGSELFGNETYPDDTVVAFGANRATGNVFYALDTDNYTPHYLSNVNIGHPMNPWVSYKEFNRTYKDNLGNVFIVSNYGAWKFDRITGTATQFFGSLSGKYLYENTFYNGNSYTLWRTNTISNYSSYMSWVVGGATGTATIKSFIPTTMSENITSTSVDVDSNGYVAGTITVYDENNKLNTHFATNRPEFAGIMSEDFFLYRYKLDALLNNQHVRVKFFNGNIYIYAKTDFNTTIYQITQGNYGTASSPSYYLQLTLAGYIQNTGVVVAGFTGNSNYVYSNNGYTNDPNVKPMPKPSSFVVGANYNGLEPFLFYPRSIGDYGIRPIAFDSKTNSLARIQDRWPYDGTNNMFIEGVFYNPASNSYNKVTQTLQFSSSVGNYSQVQGGIFPYSFGNSAFLYPIQNYVSNKSSSYTIWKMNRSGASQLFTFNDPNAIDPYKYVSSVNARQDDQGYTYILYAIATYNLSTQVNTYTYFLVTNKSGAFVTTQFYIDSIIANSLWGANVGGTMSAPFIYNGNLTFYIGNHNQGFYYNFALNNITAYPTQIAKPVNMPMFFRHTNLAFENGQIYAVGEYIGNPGGGNYRSYSGFITSVMPSYLFEDVKDFYMDQYNIFLTTGAQKSDQQLLQFNKKTMALENSSPNGIGIGFPMKARGKVMTYSSDGQTGTAKVVNAIDLEQGDPDFINTLGGKSIVPIFIGNSAAIAGDVNPIINDSNGYLINYDMSAAASLTTLTTTIANDLKNINQGSAGGKIYFLKDDTVNMAGMFSDYESDPEKISQRSWNLTHDPSMFDNNQGTIATSGQNLATTITVFDHVGKYIAKVKALDDPTYGNPALTPFAKWSTPTPLEFYIHRKPFAHFSYTLRDNPSNVTQAMFSYIEDSYDLDHSVTLAATTKGIVAKVWRWKLSSDLTWKNGLPPSILSKNNVYLLSLTVTDMEGADSDPYTVTFDTGIVTPNTLPTAVITAPAGATAANPTVYAYQKPTYKWTYADADGDPQQKYGLYVYDSSNNLVAQSNEVASNAVTFQQPSDLIEGAVYSVQIKVNDGYGYSALSAKKFFKIVTNRPPNGNISFTTPIYQNDTPLFTLTQSDPDGDDLTIKVDSSFNGGGYSNVKQWASVASGSSKAFTLGPLAQGSYSIRLTLDDGKGGIYTQTYSFTALPLFLNGAIKHTAIWESNRLQWNIKFPSKSRAADVFWAGEALEVFASATNTGASTTKPLNVSATLVQTGDVVSLTSSDQIHFSGEMVNTGFIHILEDGLYTMQFQIQWSNGMIQKTDVLFYIRGNILDVIVIQLRN